ncbi:hypothetical protein BCV69DRAFT_299486 [Microstroma glucosiphilum]|uniref:Thioesterase domain-containing protein n=1 Tax=Pseudomicrostroma glucosiphilum TaxID=1684307 RepID=A0A316U7M1_9BASI|nr:hypothetical protein BCV69DRAFT_299486 [Pseudomicrostroma glucosiphilum]PWN20353.1 hypothetical protein BCV69DRAFT_299486 [Pseudomicrostroma glucosiphilum]
MAATQESATSSASDFYDAVEEVLACILANSPIYKHLFGPAEASCLQLVRGPEGSSGPSIPGDLTFKFVSPKSEEGGEGEAAEGDTLQSHHLNSHKILHGSVSCTLVDLISGVCIASLGTTNASFNAPPPTLPSLPPTTSSSPLTQPVYPPRASILSAPRGLSTDMSVQFTSSAKMGEEVWVRTWVKKKGRHLVWVGVQVWARAAGQGERGEAKLVVEGSHTKYIK